MSCLHVIANTAGGSHKYVIDLMNAKNMKYTVYKGGQGTSLQYSSELEIIHIHSFFPFEDIGWQFMMTLRFLKSGFPNVKIFVTIHDYYWLFVNNVKKSDLSCRGFTTEWYTVSGNEPDPYMCFCTGELFKFADKVIMPSMSVYKNYKKFMRGYLPPNVHVVPHCDIPIRYENFWISPLEPGKNVNVAFIGNKGEEMFKQIVDLNLPINYRHYKGYSDETIIDTLHNDNVHIILWPSRLEETYCYALSRMINSGLPIVYYRRGAFGDRLPSNGRFFGAKKIDEICIEFKKAIQFVFDNQDRPNDYIDQGNEVVLNDWYRHNYKGERSTPVQSE